MSTLKWRWSLIGLWIAVICITFAMIGSTTVRSWQLLFAFGLIPPVMLLWLWNDDRPLLIGSLHGRRTRL